MPSVDVSTETRRQTSEQDMEYEYIPPDGDWAWFVLAGSVIVNLFICGLLKCEGVLFVEISDDFDASPVKVSWILSLSNCLFLTLGPLANYLSTKLSFRVCSAVGALFAVSGLILSSLATCVEDLYFSLGILYGVGAGLLFPMGVIIVNGYFVRRRGFAMGVFFGGGPIGSFFLPPLIRILTVTYGFRGAVLILGGLTLHVLLAAVVYVPVEQHLIRVRVDRSKCKDNPVTRRREERHDSNVASNVPPPENSSVSKRPLELESSTRRREERHDSNVASNVPPPENSSVSKSPLELESSTRRREERHDSNVASNVPPPENSSVSKRPLELESSTRRREERHDSNVASNVPPPENSSVSKRPLELESSTRRREERHDSNVASSVPPLENSSVSKRSLKLESSTRQFHVSDRSEKEQKIKKENMYATLFRDPVFYITTVSNATTAIGYTNFAMFLPAFAQTLGFNKNKGSYLLSIIAVFDLIGRIGGGTVSDWFLLQKKYYFMFGVFFSGVFMAAVSVSSLYSHIAILCAFFGLTSGIFIATQGVVLAEVLGEDKLAHSFTMAQFAKGVMNLLSPPLCGFFYERLGSYRSVFQCFGLCHMIGSTIWFLIPCVRKK